MGEEIIAGLLCIAWAVLYAARSSHPAVVVASSRRTVD